MRFGALVLLLALVSGAFAADEAFSNRIVPVDPLLSRVSATDAAMTFYWPGASADGCGVCRLSGTVDGGTAACAELGPDGRARLAFGRLSAGEHRLEVSVIAADGRGLATNAYRIVACPEPPKGPSGRRLNNFVTELVNAPLKGGEVKFFRPEDGWVWISLEDAPETVRGFLDGSASAVVYRRRGERLTETMREVKAGWHRLDIRGGEGGRLRIHAVKTITQPMWLRTPGPCDFTETNYRFTFGFARRFLIPSMNTAIGSTLYVSDKRFTDPAYYAERGVRPLPGASLPFELPRTDVDEIYRRLTGGVWSMGYDLSIDECAIGRGRREHVVMSEVLWRMADERPHQRIGVNWGDATKCSFDDPKVHTAELAAIANSGDGRGLSIPEVYTPALLTREEAEPWLALYAKQVRALGELVPAGRSCTLFNMAPYVDIGHWCDAVCPETDIKALYSWQMRAFATRPEFAACAGVGGGARGHGEEELRRWHARCLRYYAIEGGTEDLAERFGYRWTPGFVRNCDFMDGLSGWTARPAAGGAVEPETIRFYGWRAQARMKAPAGRGDSVAMFTASASGANRLLQRISGLSCGRCYALMFCTAERANAEVPSAEDPPQAFSARLEGADEMPGLTYVHRVTTAPRKTDRPVHNYLRIRRYVFRARGPEATLVFKDRDADGRAVPPGTRQVLNYVVFRPYYTETPEEVAEVGRLCSAGCTPEEIDRGKMR